MRMREPSTAVVHFYRASVMHADVWRRRLDATTNWAVVSTAGIVTFAFSRPESPHFVVLLAVVFCAFFLVMEARRYQMFHLWRRRVQMLNRWVVAPQLAPQIAPSDEEIEEGLQALAVDLGSSLPRLAFVHAVGYRLRRNYAFLLTAVFATWLLKIWYHPTPVASPGEFVEQASVGLVPGAVVLAAAGAGATVMLFLTVWARTEKMEDWNELPSPLGRALRVRGED